MPERPISDQMFDAFVDQELGQDERLRVLRSIAGDQRLGQEVCDREQIKSLLRLAYRDCSKGGQGTAAHASCGSGLLPGVPLLGRMIGALRQVASGLAAPRNGRNRPS